MAVATPAQIRYLKRRARQLNLDVSVLMANAAHEGLSGGIGDGGHAFGPFQMNDAGGVLTGKLPGNWSAQRKNQWAWSKAGIDYALKGIARVAAGKRGAAAMRSIVLEYERPANMHQKLEERLAAWRSGKYGTSNALGKTPGAMRRGSSRSVMRLDQRAFREKAAQAFLMASQAAVEGDFRPQTQMAQILEGIRQDSMRRVQVHSAGGGASRGGATLKVGGPQSGALTELIHDPMRYSIFDGHVKQGAYGGHGGHVHAAFATPKAMLAAIRYAQKIGLRVGENPYTDRVDPVHTDGSHHYQNFKGRFNGKKLGKAGDFSGDPQKMRQFFKWVERRYR